MLAQYLEGLRYIKQFGVLTDTPMNCCCRKISNDVFIASRMNSTPYDREIICLESMCFDDTCDRYISYYLLNHFYDDKSFT